MERGSTSSSPSAFVRCKNNVFILSTMKLFLLLVFSGWIFVWLLAPTSKYQYGGWAMELHMNTNSTYFGLEGTNILIFTFPILLIAVLGCFYLEMLKKTANTEKGKIGSVLALWKRPLLVNGPLGVVSGIEFAFSLMFVAMLIYCFSTYVGVGFHHLMSFHPSDKLWQVKLRSVSYKLGQIGNICCAFLFFPVTRCSSLLPLIGLTSDSSIKYHVWIGHIAMVFLTGHGFGYFLYWAITGQLNLVITWAHSWVSNAAGEIALLAGLAIWITTFPKIRRRSFELFYYTHHLYIVFLLFYLLHLGIAAFCIVLPGVYLFMVDRYLRFLQSRNNARLVSARLLPSQGIELNFAKDPGFTYNPLSTLFINVPSVSRLQWHPFTITSSGRLEPDRLSIVIKKEGTWTQKLYNALSSPDALDRLDVSVEGPYSPPSSEFLRYDSLVMVSGGSGITPFISIIREIIHRCITLNIRTPNLLLVCAFKNSMDLTMLDLLLPITGDVSDLSGLNLRIEVYITREKEAPTNDAQKMIRTVCFKPSQSDLPVSPVLGSHNWLSLAAVITSSFVAFLILIGILQRFYIYPIDKNTNAIYSYSSRATLNLLFICICIAVASSLVFLKSKINSLKVAKQIKSLDLPTPMTSPSSWFCTEKEMESLPQESIVKATSVHYGGRPNLKKILFDIDGENVGVMASGPSGLRHEVALVCGSGLADNLHYESISFNW